MKQTEIYVKSTIDSTMQPSLFFKSGKSGKRPLLVGLHTWSYDRFNQINNMLPYAEKYGFHLLLPEFRGPNLSSNPNKFDACGSLAAKQDIKDAIDYVTEHEEVDTDNIFLLGASGGGHMTLLMCGFCPEYFKAAGAFVGITDLKKWKDENKNYTEHVLACCNNDESEMLKRSPISYIDTIAKANLKIFHGKSDPSVPFMHSVNFYNALLDRHPDASVYLDIFDGGHNMSMETAMTWLLSQYSKEKEESVTG